MAIPQAAAGVLLRGRSAPIRIAVSVTPCIWPGRFPSPPGGVGDPFPPSSFPQALVKSAESARAAVSSRTPRLSVWLLIESLFPWFACRACSPTEIWQRADWLGGAGGRPAPRRRDCTISSALVQALRLKGSTFTRAVGQRGNALQPLCRRRGCGSQTADRGVRVARRRARGRGGGFGASPAGSAAAR